MTDDIQELERIAARITEELKGPIPDLDRVLLVADRTDIRIKIRDLKSRQIDAASK